MRDEKAGVTWLSPGSRQGGGHRRVGGTGTITALKLIGLKHNYLPSSGI